MGCRTRRAHVGLLPAHGFGRDTRLFRNAAGATNASGVLGLRLRTGVDADGRLGSWSSQYVRLSREIEGHAMGRAALKLEPREAARVLNLPLDAIAWIEVSATDALETLRAWKR